MKCGCTFRRAAKTIASRRIICSLLTSFLIVSKARFKLVIDITWEIKEPSCDLFFTVRMNIGGSIPAIKTRNDPQASTGTPRSPHMRKAAGMSRARDMAGARATCSRSQL